MRSMPLVGLTTDRKMVGPHPFMTAGEKYVRALVDGANVMPVLVPSLLPPLDPDAVLEPLDGLLMTGSPSNIEPRHYGNEPSYEGNLHDPARDANTLALVNAAIARRLPVLAVCRGLQEVNVALGGTLHQKVHEYPGHDDHRENGDDPLDVQYGPAHPIALTPGGLLAGIARTESEIVNSLHGQGIRTLGAGLVVEGRAPDGLVEAVRLDRADTFLLAVQWHPEWKVMENPFSLGIFRRFGDACRAHAAARR
jgi:putative glutamine amidotransferase